MGSTTSRTPVILGNLYRVCPGREVVLIQEFVWLGHDISDIYIVTVLTGEERGITKAIRRRNLILSETKKPDKESVIRYKLHELLPQIGVNLPEIARLIFDENNQSHLQ